MRARGAKSFTVEVKSRKRRSLWAPSTFKDINTERESYSAQPLPSNFLALNFSRAEEHGSLADRATEPFELAAPANSEVHEAESKAKGLERQAKRILPDLSRDEPFEALLREKAEEQTSAHRQPRRPRTKTAELAKSRAKRQPGKKRTTRRNPTIEQNPPIPAGVVPASEPSTPALVAAKVPGQVKMGERIASQNVRRTSNARSRRRDMRGLNRTWADRAAHRRAQRRGVPVRLRAGERWKRRLPPACW